MAMTWKTLAEKISRLTESQQNMDVTVVDPKTKEAYPVTHHLVGPGIEESEGVDLGLALGIGDNQPYLIIRTW